MADTKTYVDSKSWLDRLEEFDDDITITNTGAVTGGISLNSGAGTGWAYPNTITGTNGPYTISSATGITSPWATSTSTGQLKLEGEKADLVINGKSLTDTLSKLEERLNILNVNEKLESEWEELKELGDRYRELEAHITAKMKTFESLKRYDES